MVAFSFASTMRLRLLAPLLAAPAAMLLNPGRAEAVLTYNIFESGSDVVVSTSGSLNTAAASVLGAFPATGVQNNLNRSAGRVWTGFGSPSTFYGISGPTFLQGAGGTFAQSVPTLLNGTWTALAANFQQFAIANSYTSGSSFSSTATFANRTLASFGLTTLGIGGNTWSLLGAGGASVDTIQVNIGAPAPVPGPLPLLGAAAAFGWSRRLRRRISVSNTTIVG